MKMYQAPTPEQTQRFEKDVVMLSKFICHAIDTHIPVKKLDPLVYTAALVNLIKSSLVDVPKEDQVFVYNGVKATIDLVFEQLLDGEIK